MIIGIDTSGGVCSVAAVSCGKLISEFSINHNKTHSAMLIPMLDRMLSSCDLSLKDASLIGVANGPGSFTGLRIGAASAKGLGLALNVPVVGISTLLALSYNLSNSHSFVCPIMDARRNEVYTAVYNYKNKSDTIDSAVIEPSAMSIFKLLAMLNELGEPIIFLGDAVPVYSDIIEREAKIKYDYASGNNGLQRASSVAILAEKSFYNGNSIPLSLSYLRRPQAERERLKL